MNIYEASEERVKWLKVVRTEADRQVMRERVAGFWSTRRQNFTRTEIEEMLVLTPAGLTALERLCDFHRMVERSLPTPMFNPGQSPRLKRVVVEVLLWYATETFPNAFDPSLNDFEWRSSLAPPRFTKRSSVKLALTTEDFCILRSLGIAAA